MATEAGVASHGVARMLPTPYRVTARRRELEDTVTLELAPTRGAGIRPPLPGQFNMLYAFGVGEIPISTSGDPDREDVLVHTTRAVGKVSEALCSARLGDTLGVRGPFGSAWPLDALQGKDVLVVAGGVGLAPLRPAIVAATQPRMSHASVSILIGARQPDQVLFGNEFDTWRALGADVLVTVDAASPGWRQHVGVVTDLVSLVRFDPANAIALVCGPEIMMRFTARKLMDVGVPADAVHVTMERNMQCAIGLCGHCQYGPDFVCMDGPVFPFAEVERRFFLPET